MNNEFKLWLNLSAKIQENDIDLICPKCNKKDIDHIYVGDINSRLGFMEVWCNSCLHGIHISRVKIPNDMEMLSFEITGNEFDNRVPKFKHITP